MYSEQYIIRSKDLFFDFLICQINIRILRKIIFYKVIYQVARDKALASFLLIFNFLIVAFNFVFTP